MEIDAIIERLTELRDQLRTDVVAAYQEKGREFGVSRFKRWKKRAHFFFQQNLPNEQDDLDAAVRPRSVSFVGRIPRPPAQVFWEDYGARAHSFIESLIIDIENGDCDLESHEPASLPQPKKDSHNKQNNSVFIVHGRDNEAKQRTARFVEKLGLEAIILHEQANRGQTIIEKIEHYSNVPFAIVLYTADDLGNLSTDAEAGELKKRARQNVVFEHGYLISKIGRENVACLVSDGVELPNDISGIVYISDDNWQFNLAKEMKHAGLDLNVDRIF